MFEIRLSVVVAKMTIFDKAVSNPQDTTLTRFFSVCHVLALKVKDVE